jgi:hypothetical protein
VTANLNTPSITAGPLTAADLDRKTNTGRIYQLHRATVSGRDTCNGSCQSLLGCDCYETWRTAAPTSTGYGDAMKPMPKIIECRPLSLMARLALAWRRFWRG